MILKYLKQISRITFEIHPTTYLFLVAISIINIYSGLFLLGVYLFVFLHEHGHIYAGEKYGIKTDKIIMFPFGGMALLTALGKNHWESFVISIAGPLINLILAMMFLFLYVIIQNDFIFYCMFINIYVFLFNLIPAFPMDGGRILKALLGMNKVNPYKSKKIVTYVSKACAVGMIVLALILPINIMLLFVGIILLFLSNK